MRKFFISWGVAALSLFLASLLLGSRMEFDSFWSVIWTALLVGFLNAVLAPLLNLLTCPVYLLTLGLSRFLVTGGLILLAGSLVRGFHIAGFWWAVLAAVIVSIATTFMGGRRARRDRD